MCTGSRPSTSSTRTSRTCRAIVPCVLEQLEHGGQRAHRYAALAALAHDARAGGPRRRGDRDDDFVGLGLLEDARQVILGVAAHAHPVDAQPVLARVVVEEADGRQPELAVAGGLGRGDACDPLALSAAVSELPRTRRRRRQLR